MWEARKWHRDRQGNGRRCGDITYVGTVSLAVVRVSGRADRMGAMMGKFDAMRRQVDVTHVKRGQLAAITRLRPEPSQRAQEAIARVAARRGKR